MNKAFFVLVDLLLLDVLEVLVEGVEEEEDADEEG
jgi:hypothetical protein